MEGRGAGGGPHLGPGNGSVDIGRMGVGGISVAVRARVLSGWRASFVLDRSPSPFLLAPAGLGQDGHTVGTAFGRILPQLWTVPGPAVGAVGRRVVGNGSCVRAALVVSTTELAIAYERSMCGGPFNAETAN